MKKIPLVLALFLAAVSASAQEKAHPFYIGIGTGLDFPASGWNPDYYVGGGAHFFGGVKLDPACAAQLDIQDWAYLGGGQAQYHFRFLAEAKVTLPGDAWQPYFIAGPGLSLRTFYFGGQSASNLDLLAGVGAQVGLGGDSHLFVQAALNALVDASPAVLDLPLTAGLWVGL
ncbi:MAG TPA: outer membrane beta-barrel protein [bacterium]|nr:outer membrane beta-barrel protein [bacterium]